MLRNIWKNYSSKLVDMQTLVDSLRGYHWKRFKMNKKGWNRPQKVFQPALGCTQHPKAGQNTQQVFLHGKFYKRNKTGLDQFNERASWHPLKWFVRVVALACPIIILGLFTYTLHLALFSRIVQVMIWIPRYYTITFDFVWQKESTFKEKLWSTAIPLTTKTEGRSRHTSCPFTPTFCYIYWT